MNHSTITRAPRRITLLAASLLAASVVALTACAPAAQPSTASESVTVTDPWVKAAEEGMTAAFGILSNPTGDDLVVVSAETEVADSAQLHETVADESGNTTMQEVKHGFTIPAGGELALEPGGNHLMLMGLVGPVLAGEEVTFTLTFSDDSTLSFTAPVKDYSGAKEEYSEHDMSGGEH